MSRASEAKRRDGNEIEFSRIVAFSDGVFAIAITLLVLSLDIPPHLHNHDLTQALLDQKHNLYAYALSFAVIGRFWVVHHRFFSQVTGFDGRLLGLNLLYLGWIVLIPFSSQVLGDHSSETPAVVLYAINLSGVVVVGSLMFADARRAGLTLSDPEEGAAFNRRSLITGAVFLASIPVAYIDASLATYMWLSLFVVPAGAALFRRLS